MPGISLIGTNPRNLVASPRHSCTFTHTSPRANLLFFNLRPGSRVPCCLSSALVFWILFLFLIELGSLLQAFFLVCLTSSLFLNLSDNHRNTVEYPFSLRVAANWYGGSFYGDKNILKLGCSDACKTVNMQKNYCTGTLNR